MSLWNVLRRRELRRRIACASDSLLVDLSDEMEGDPAFEDPRQRFAYDVDELQTLLDGGRYWPEQTGTSDQLERIKALVASLLAESTAHQAPTTTSALVTLAKIFDDAG